MSLKRFWDKVDIRDEKDCWEWKALTNLSGYGRFRYQGKMELSHRVSWEITNGSIPDNLCVLHKCDNPRCVNPNHLFLGTRQDNSLDMVVKNRDRNGDQKGENNGFSKLTWDNVNKIRELRKQNIPLDVLAKNFEVSKSTISLIVNYKIWR